MPGIDANTLMMLHMDGANLGTSFTDSANSPTVITANGDAITSTITPKFGTAAYLGGGLAGYLQGNVAAGLQTIAADFTIDFWVRFTAASGIHSLFALCDKDTGNHTLRVNYNFTTQKWTWIIDYDGSTQVFQSTTDATITNGTWYHVALVRTSGVVKLFVNGSQIGTNVSTSGAITGLANWLWARSWNSGNELSGGLDEGRVSNIARWTNPFTPPTAPYDSSSSASGNSGMLLMGVG